MCSIIGLLTIGTMGLGRSQVSGRRRVPDPPAIKTAFIRFQSLSFGCAWSMVSFLELLMSHIYLSTPIDSQQWHQELDALLGLSAFFTEVWVAPEQPRALITTQVHTALYYLVAE